MNLRAGWEHFNQSNILETIALLCMYIYLSLEGIRIRVL